MVTSKRVTFAFEQNLGHVVFEQNLRRVLQKKSDWQQTWLPISYQFESRLEEMPVLRNNWSLRGSLKTHRLLRFYRQNKHQSPNLYFFHTQAISLFSSKEINPTIPIIVSMDATPAAFARLKGYDHFVNPPHIEKFISQLHQQAFERATRFVVMSAWAGQSLIHDYGVPAEKVKVIPNGVNLDFWQLPHPAFRLNRPHHKPQLLFVGADFKRKGGYFLLETFRSHLSGLCDLHLVTDADVPAEKGIFLHRNLKPNSPELQQLFRQADIFVLPTRGDCSPNAIVEAMAAGLPVIATRVAGIPEMVLHGENGFLIEPDAAGELVEAVKWLVEDAALRQHMGMVSRRRAEAYFDVSRNASTILNEINSLL